MKRLGTVVVIFCLISGFLLADWGETQPITPEQKAFMENSYKKVIELLPAPAEGVSKKAQELEIPKNLGLGSENHPMYFSFYCQYDKQMSMGNFADMANDSSGIEEMSQQVSKISEEMTAAIEKNDQKEVQRLQEKLQTVMQGNAGMQKMRNSVEDIKKNSLQITIEINGHGGDFSPMKEIPAPSPAIYAIRRDKTTDKRPSFTNAETIVFIGSFTKKITKDIFQIYAPDDQGQATRIHRMILNFKGEPTLVDEYIARMDLTKLVELVK